MITVNCSNKDEYYTQRNNKHTPFISCFATSMISLLDYRNISIIAPDGMEVQVNEFQNTYNKQPEDYLTELLCTKRAREFWSSRYHKSPKNNQQRFNYRTVAWVVNNLLCKKEVVKYKKNMFLKEILYNTMQNKPAVIGGKFTKEGHMVCVVGFITLQEDVLDIKQIKDLEKDKITHVIIDDPYGNYFKQYKDVKGNNVQFPLNLFNDLTNGSWERKYIIM